MPLPDPPDWQALRDARRARVRAWAERRAAGNREARLNPDQLAALAAAAAARRAERAERRAAEGSPARPAPLPVDKGG